MGFRLEAETNAIPTLVFHWVRVLKCQHLKEITYWKGRTCPVTGILVLSNAYIVNMLFVPTCHIPNTLKLLTDYQCK